MLNDKHDRAINMEKKIAIYTNNSITRLVGCVLLVGTAMMYLITQRCFTADSKICARGKARLIEARLFLAGFCVAGGHVPILKSMFVATVLLR